MTAMHITKKFAGVAEAVEWLALNGWALDRPSARLVPPDWTKGKLRATVHASGLVEMSRD